MAAMYLGQTLNSQNWETTATQHLLSSDVLLTHAFCVGMTGSGKTGLCIDVIEEVALQGKAVLLVDLKGDLANIALQFPKFQAQDYLPYISETVIDEEQRLAQATQAAEQWQSNLQAAGIGSERLEALKAAVEFRLYTPGTNLGRRISVLDLLGKIKPDALDEEMLANAVHNAVRALLQLLGQDSDLQNREYALLSNIFNHYLLQGNQAELTLFKLIQLIQEPPFKTLGVMEVENFFPAKERQSLAFKINALLANPQFARWLEGEALDMQSILYTASGKPCVAIVSLQHLAEQERHFFLTLLLNSLLNWLNLQSGTSHLRALLYIDEIFGYLPPVANPPCKPALLTLLKQARAFGLGVLLATQNPVDLDYKALANCGTWWIGHLQTARDRERLLSGLAVANDSANKFTTLNTLLAALPKRAFLEMTQSKPELSLFRSRQTMAYLAGPLSRQQRKFLAVALQAEKEETVVTATAETTFNAREVSAAMYGNADSSASAHQVATPSLAQDAGVAANMDEIVQAAAVGKLAAEVSAVAGKDESAQAAVSDLDLAEQRDEAAYAAVGLLKQAAGTVNKDSRFVMDIQQISESLADIDSSVPLYFASVTPATASTVDARLQRKTNTYRPYVFAKVRYYFNNNGISNVGAQELAYSEQLYLALPEQAELLDWTAAEVADAFLPYLSTSKPEGAFLQKLPTWAKKGAVYRRWQSKLQEYIYRSRHLAILYNPQSKTAVLASKGEATLQALTAAKAAQDQRVAKLEAKHLTALKSLNNRLTTAKNALAREEAESTASNLNTAISIGAGLLGGLGKLLGGKGSTGALRSVNRSVKQRGDVQRAKGKVQEIEALISATTVEQANELAALKVQIAAEYSKYETRQLDLKKSDITIEALGLLWLA